MNETLLQLLKEYQGRVPEWAREPVVFGYRGSHAHNTYVPPEDPNGTDDVDVFAVVARPFGHYLSYDGYFQRHETLETAGERLDILVYDLRKFIHLLRKGNPNVQGWLWTDPEFAGGTPFRPEAADLLYRNRERFLSKAILKGIHGYATAQFKKMLQGQTGGYMGAKRKELLRRYGFDIKDAAHCIRLLHQGLALVRTGRMVVRMEGAVREEVLAVKTGQRTIREVERLADSLFAEFRAAEPSCTLPDEVPVEVADEVFFHAIMAH